MSFRTFAFVSAIALVTLGAANSRSSAALLINEIDSDNVGTDSQEFVELIDAPGTNLSGYVLVFYNGAGDLSYRAIDLDGLTTDSNGYVIVGNTAVPGVDVIFASSTLQNGQDAVALYTGDATAFPNGTPVTTVNLIDAVVYDTGQADDAGLLALLTGGSQIDENGSGAGTTHSIGRIPNGSGIGRDTSTYSVNVPTPNAANIAVPEPASAMVFGAAAGMLALRRRRRR